MTQETLATVKANLSRYVDAAEQQHERTTITRNGKPAAVLISVEDLESLEETLSILSDPEAMREIAEARAAYARGEFFTLDQVRSDLGARRRTEGG